MMSHDTTNKPSSSDGVSSIQEGHGHNLEYRFVKSTYDAIAEDFSSTRYKKWPKVDAYLHSLPDSSLILDVGCGNGKYLDNAHTYNIGCDLSFNLLKICKSRNFEVVLCDMTRLPFRRSVFDSVISIAALHHLTTTKRRERCLENIVNLMNPDRSSCLVQVWSFEQEFEKDNPYLKHRFNSSEESEAAPNMFIKIDDDLRLPIHKNRTPFQQQDILVPFHSKSANSNQDDTAAGKKLRYYHVFRQGELEEMLHKIPGIELLQTYYDKGNWSVLAVKGETIKRTNIYPEST